MSTIEHYFAEDNYDYSNIYFSTFNLYNLSENITYSISVQNNHCNILPIWY